jgi:hypothetical protein
VLNDATAAVHKCEQIAAETGPCPSVGRTDKTGTMTARPPEWIGVQSLAGSREHLAAFRRESAAGARRELSLLSADDYGRQSQRADAAASATTTSEGCFAMGRSDGAAVLGPVGDPGPSKQPRFEPAGRRRAS